MPLYQQGGLGRKGFDTGDSGLKVLQAFQMYLNKKRMDEQQQRQRELFPLEKEYLQARTTAALRPPSSEYQLTTMMGPDGKPTMYRVPKTGGMPEPIGRAATPKPSVGSSVAEYMSTLEPGSPEWKEAAKITAGGTTVNVGTGASPLEKSTKGAVERQIEEIDDILLTLGEVDKLTQDQFLTYGGQLKAKGTKMGEKITGMELPSSEFLGNYSQWQMLSQDLYLKKRKQITGVAARPEEAAEIAKAIPDPTKDSPSQFRAKQMLLQNILQKHKERLVKLRAIGIENPTKEQLAAFPLEPKNTMPTTIEDIDRELAEIDRQLGIK